MKEYTPPPPRSDLIRRLDWYAAQPGAITPESAQKLAWDARAQIERLQALVKP